MSLSEVRKPKGQTRQRTSLENPRSEGDCERLKKREARERERESRRLETETPFGCIHAGHGSYGVIKTNNHRGEVSHSPLQIYTNADRQG